MVPHPFVKTKAITHQLVQGDARRPQGWSAVFAEKVRDVTLPGYTVFNADDARLAVRRMLDRGPVRVKQPLGASGRGQTRVTAVDQLERFLEQFDADEMATYGLVLEENLREVRTLSVGHVAVDSLTIAYYVAKAGAGKRWARGLRRLRSRLLARRVGSTEGAGTNSGVPHRSCSGQILRSVDERVSRLHGLAAELRCSPGHRFGRSAPIRGARVVMARGWCEQR